MSNRFFTNPDFPLIAVEVEKVTGVRIHQRGSKLQLEGEPHQKELVKRFLTQMLTDQAPEPCDVERLLGILRTGLDPSTVLDDHVLPRTALGRGVTPKSMAQKRYVEALRTHKLTFGIGPAGTGKTFLAVAMAVRRFLDKEVSRIVLSRPAIEAGESLGFLPGTLEDKMMPYMRPLYDALFELLGPEKTTELLENQTIEVAPLAFLRGRTLNNSFIILDEAQNATREQMKMFLTRIGRGSWTVVTGDPSQVDIAEGQSGLGHAVSVLHGVPQVAFCRLTGVDVMRDPLVADIVRAYDAQKAPT